jgi:hypothetical protein
MQYKLSDETIASIAKLFQLAILTGTDIVDNLRTLRLEADDGTLNPTEEFTRNFEKGINDLAQKALDLQSDVN